MYTPYVTVEEYKKNYISNFLIRLDLETKLSEGEYD